MKARIEKLANWIDALSLRERAAILLAIIVAIFVLWHEVMLSPLDKSATALQIKVKKQTKDLERVRAQQKLILQRASVDPDAETRSDIDALKTAMTALDKRLREMTVNLVEPARMAQVLEDVLTRNTDLKLVRVEVLEPRPLNEPAKGDKADSDTNNKLPDVYKHALQIEFEGSYLSTLEYMRQIEGLSQQFYWGSINFVVDQFPTARITITVNTLSLSEEWIGV